MVFFSRRPFPGWAAKSGYGENNGRLPLV